MWANDDCSDSRWSEEGQPSVRLGQAHISLMNGGIGLRHDAVALVEKQKAKAIKQAKKLLQREGLLPPDEPLAS